MIRVQSTRIRVQHLLMRLIFWSLFAGVLAGCATLGGNEEGATPVSWVGRSGRRNLICSLIKKSLFNARRKRGLALETVLIRNSGTFGWAEFNRADFHDRLTETKPQPVKSWWWNVTAADLWQPPPLFLWLFSCVFFVQSVCFWSSCSRREGVLVFSISCLLSDERVTLCSPRYFKF